MQDLVASKTALGTSLMRALHARADPLTVFDDRWGDRLVPPSVVDFVRLRASEAMADDPRVPAGASPDAILDTWLRVNAAYANVIIRSRYAEDALAAAILAGIRQYVLIGAGFDSYALRRPAGAQHVEIFEIDHPATQVLKRQQIAACGLLLPASVHFLAMDLDKESFGDVLSRSAFDPAAPTFFTWLGVTMYLTRESNLNSLRAISRCAAPGSELVFTYLDQQLFRLSEGAESKAFAELQRTVATVGEPFISGFDPHALAQDLRAIGFELLEDCNDVELLKRYDPEGVNRLAPMGQGHVARARRAA